jgi:hypothetical protein
LRQNLLSQSVKLRVALHCPLGALVGLHYLKAMYNESDESVVEK